MSDTIIKVENVSKCYRLGGSRGYKTFRETLSGLAVSPFRKREEPETLWALNDISFKVRRGDVLGIVGRNGAGKSTLLKILSRITEPTSGRVELRGRVGSLLEVGTGFHPELSGRENVYLYGAILGMSRQEISRKFEEIIAFAEVERFVDTPVKRYSSGMYMRLAFSVAAHLEPEILLVDEVLAVGDAIFQRKCIQKMAEAAGGGRTIIFVSHNMATAASICKQGIVLGEGRILFEGKIQGAIDFYENSIFKNKYLKEDIHARKDRSGTMDVKLVSFHMENEAGEKIQEIRNGHAVKLVFGYRTRQESGARNVDFGILVEREDGRRVFQFGTRFTGQKLRNIPSQGVIECVIKRFPLAPGKYRLGTYIESETHPADYIKALTYLDVVDGNFYGSNYQVYEEESRILVDGSWSCSSGL